MIDPIAFQIGPIAIRWYALCIMTGLVLAVYLAMREAPLKGLKSDDIIDFILVGFPLAIVGARLYYVAFEWSYYMEHPAEIFAIWNGGIAIYGGLLMGTLWLFIFCYYRVIKPVYLLDIAVPGVMIAQSIGRWGNFFNQEAYGKVVASLDYLPKFMQQQLFIDGAYRTPTFLYESLWNLLGFSILMSLRHRPKFFKDGDITGFYLIWYGCGRFVIEGMRTDSLMFFGLRVSQWLSALLVLLGLGLIVVRRRRQDVAWYLPGPRLKKEK